MPTIEESLKAFIESQAPAAGKGYPHEVPLDAGFPAWAYHTITDEETLGHGGRVGFAKARIQCDFIASETALASDYANVKSIASDVRDALDGYKGSMGNVTVDYCHVELIDDWADLHKLPVQRFDVVLSYHR